MNRLRLALILSFLALALPAKVSARPLPPPLPFHSYALLNRQ